ncbi:single-stranded DNA-binding protein (plasmid) [Aneurinibacillus sp. Ricciae_BoGa-3]|uniref:single-stranded DNA-binding protein n=1 Tax=Aneurinibacillus sp. Ricciae_BoGa-3 TaxID=3022697 RepID=UPI00233FD6F2|nr:single-stranded DNA-binding protein [Aneurinibacillus sp. Ricciae_BoGa-3]WCK56962.1 single-stranded DNA-binding protein [Aneurinibacillus sp. Ricciae_BoGa-3]
MHTIEKVIRKIKGEDKIMDFLLGSGRLTSNPPEIREVNGYKVLSAYGFSMKFSNGRDKKPDFYGIELWGKNAEYMKELGYEGQLIEVIGRIEVRHFHNKEVKILVVERFHCLEYKPKEVSFQTEETSFQHSNGDGINKEKDSFNEFPI